MKTDWKKTLRELSQRGVTHGQIANHLQSSGLEYTKSAVHKLSGGVTAEPPHSVGELILALHQQKTRD
mgnify:FL=1